MYLLLHIKKHLFGIGVGIRQFLDLAIIMNSTNIDFAFIEKEFEKLGLVKYMQVVLTMIYKWFNIGSELIAISDEFYENQTLEILKNGVHGKDNEENKLNSAFKRLSNKDNKLSFKNRINYIKEKVFPSYDSLLKQDKYKFIEKKKYLLPVAWFYRFILSIVNNRAINEIKELITSAFLSKKIMDKKKEARDSWGI